MWITAGVVLVAVVAGGALYLRARSRGERGRPSWTASSPGSGTPLSRLGFVIASATGVLMFLPGGASWLTARAAAGISFVSWSGVTVEGRLLAYT